MKAGYTIKKTEIAIVSQCLYVYNWNLINVYQEVYSAIPPRKISLKQCVGAKQPLNTNAGNYRPMVLHRSFRNSNDNLLVKTKMAEL